MSDVLKRYYEKSTAIPHLVRDKLERFQNHPDICEEFENWIETKQYKDTDGVVVEGYTAKQIAEISAYAGEEFAFLTLIELRENPGKAKRRINAGFKKSEYTRHTGFI
jgi:hypothetical protein